MSGTENPTTAAGEGLVEDSTVIPGPVVDPSDFDGLGIFSTENPPTAPGIDMVPGSTEEPTAPDEGLTAEDAAALVEQEVG
jgi:hypothetical protein